MNRTATSPTARLVHVRELVGSTSRRGCGELSTLFGLGRKVWAAGELWETFAASGCKGDLAAWRFACRRRLPRMLGFVGAESSVAYAHCRSLIHRVALVSGWCVLVVLVTRSESVFLPKDRWAVSDQRIEPDTFPKK